MTKFVKRLRGEKGLTIIELIASLTVLALVVGILYSFTTFGLRSYHKVQIENSLRDEGDILMSSIISELYVFGPESISTQIKTAGTIDNGTLILSKRGAVDREIRILQGKLVIRDKLTGSPLESTDVIRGEISVKSKLRQPESEIKLTCLNIDSTCKSGLIEINLLLEQTFENKVYPLELNSRFGF